MSICAKKEDIEDFERRQNIINKSKLKVDYDNPGNTSDGYHTFNELYDHRVLLYISLMNAYPDISWKSKLHENGTGFDGWFIAGMKLPTGNITYHLPDDKWELLKHIKTLDKGVKWDGHTPNDVIERLTKWNKLNNAIRK